MENVNPNAQTIENSLKEILKYIGEDPERQGLKDTPKRVVKMWKELFKGYDKNQSPKITIFDNGKDGIIYDQMIIDSGEFYSNCEHHMLPFFGTYYFAYIPNPKGKILGLSKVARVVDYYAAKLQIQERLCSDIVNCLENSLDYEYQPLAIGIIIKAEHLCKSMRGVKKKGTMTTAYLKGLFKTDINSKNELMQHIK